MKALNVMALKFTTGCAGMGLAHSKTFGTFLMAKFNLLKS